MRKNSGAATDEERYRLETTGEFHLGEFVNKFVHGCVSKTHVASLPHTNVCVIYCAYDSYVSFPHDHHPLTHAQTRTPQNSSLVLQPSDATAPLPTTATTDDTAAAAAEEEEEGGDGEGEGGKGGLKARAAAAASSLLFGTVNGAFCVCFGGDGGGGGGEHIH